MIVHYLAQRRHLFGHSFETLTVDCITDVCDVPSACWGRVVAPGGAAHEPQSRSSSFEGLGLIRMNQKII